MRRIALFCLLVLAMVWGLAACQRNTPSAAAPVPVAPASAATVTPAESAASTVARGAAEDSPEALMQEAFPDWGRERPYVMSIAEPDPKGHDSVTVATSPAQVVSIDATHRVLAVIGTISDNVGHLGGGHSVPGNLGAYWFELRDGRWFVTHRRDSILWAGSSGNLGTVKQADLGPTAHALVVESGWCGQGYCVGALDVVEIGSDAAPLVLTVVPLSSESLGVAEGCKEVLQGAKDLAPVVMQALTPDNCFDIGGKWRIEPRADSDRGDFVIDFDGNELVEDAATHAKSIHKVAESMVFRHSGHGYKQSSGRNPNHRV